MNDILKELLSNNEIIPTDKSGDISLSLKERCAKDLNLFCQTYFPDVFSSEFCEFHLEVFQSCQDMILKNPDMEDLYARAAPRGHAKSTIISFGLPMWCICYGYRFNILILSNERSLAEQFISDIKKQLEENEDIIRDFGNLVGKQTWRNNKIVTANGIHIYGKGAGQSLRGARYNNRRPDVVIIDDLEADEQVETEGQRTKLYNWFAKVLLPVGGTNTKFIYIGTVLHYEALLFKVLNDVKFSMWNRKTYKAVYEFSASEHWDKWEDILSDLSNEDAGKDAYEYYQQHKEDMLEGVQCLWPEKEPDYYYKLMIKRFTDEDAFNSEQQNDPISEKSRIFKEQWLNDNQYDTLPCEIKAIAMAVDPSMGKNKRADTSAIMAVGLGTDNYLYTLTADICRRSPDKIMDDVLLHAIINIDKLKVFRVETNVFQEFFATEMKRRTLAAGIHIPWDDIKQTSDKDMRIKSLVPKIKNGYIKIHRSHTTLLSQLKNYPKGKVDGIDCLEMCIDALMGKGAMGAFSFTSINTVQSKPKASFNPLNIFNRR